MNAQAIVDLLASKQILLTANGDRLGVEAKKGALTADLAQLIKNNKAELLDYFSQYDVTSSNSFVIPKVERVNGKGYDLSAAQKRFWFIDNLQGDSSEYHMPMAFKISDKVNLAYLEQVLNRVLTKHEVLKSHYQMVADGVVEQFISDQTLTIHNHDLCSENEATLAQKVYQQSLQPFNLAQDLMMRADLFKVASELGYHALLVINIHHIACDAWSLDILKQELMDGYLGLLEGNMLDQTLDLQYLDYAQWQAQWLVSPDYNVQLNYWSKQLQNVPQLHSLPIDFARPEIKAPFGRKLSTSIDTKDVKGLYSLCEHFSMTPFMMLHACLSVALAQYGNYQDVVIGTTISNRNGEQLNELIGCFLNRLVLRVDTESEQALETYLEQVSQVHSQAQSNQLLPFDSLVEELNVSRAGNYSPLFQIQFTTGSDMGELALEEAEMLKRVGFEPFDFSGDQVVIRGDLDIHANIGEHEIELDWSYDNQLFTSETISSIAETYTHIVANLVAVFAQGQLGQSKVKSLLASQKSNLTQQLGIDRQDPKVGLIERFEQQVVKNPHAIAVTDNDQTLSYAMLNIQANKLADCLLEQGLEPGELVGVCMQRGAALMVALLGVLKTGAAYIPFEPGNSKGRNQQIIEDAGLEWVVVSEELTPQIPDAGVDMLVLETNVTESNWLAGYSADNLNVIPDDTAPAYVIYTSGSTGKPKGVEISHTSLMDYLNYGLAEYYAAHLDGALLITSHGFDIGVPSLYLPLLQGDCVNLLDNEELLPNLAKQMESARENYLIRMTPNHVEGILTLLTTDENNGRHVFVIGGERFDRELAIALQQQFPNSQIFNHYGPSEATVGCVIYDVTANRSQLPAELPIGKPMHNTHAYVLDEAVNVLPLGAKGELLIGGPCLATGYINNPILTASQFIDNPYFDATDKRSPKRLYRTGDQVRYQADGNLMFLGRVDDQVKIRGFRIELGDIASQLNQLPEVESAQVVAKDFGTGTQLVAYIKGATADSDDVEFVNLCRQQLVQNLPKYMVPDSFVVITNWPLTPNGKLDKKSLPAPTGTAQGDIYIAPANSTEQALVEIWSKLLKQPQENISTDVSFFSLGGHSLLSVRLVAELRAVFGVELSIRELFDNNCISAQASLLINKQGNDTQIYTAIPAVARPENGLIPASSAQQRIWFIDRLQGGSAEYNMPAAFNVTGEFDLILAQQALQTIVDRHEVLRTRYVEKDGQLYQHIQKQQKIEITEHDLGYLSVDAQMSAADKLIAFDSQQTFSLTSDLMVRASYIRLTDNTGIFFFNMHHIASDGWSMEVLLNEFITFYDTLYSCKTITLKTPEIQYGDFSHWQNLWLKSDEMQSQMYYWLGQLDDLPKVHGLPLNNARSEVKSNIGGQVSAELMPQTTRKLLALTKRLEITPFMMLHGALALVLSRHSNSQDIVIGTPVANRQHSELGSLIGFFVNSLVLRVNTGHTSVSDYFEHVKQTHIDAQSNQSIPFDRLVERLNIDRSATHSPLFQIMLLTDNDYALDCAESSNAQRWRLGQAELIAKQDNNINVKFDLDIHMSISDQGGQINWTYDKQLFSEQQVSTMLQHMCNLLDSLSNINNEGTSLSALAMLNHQEQSYLVDELNKTQKKYDDSLCIHALFESQVDANPDGIALTFNDHKLSYLALDKHVNQLANYLVINHNVTPDTLVGVCTQRSNEMIIALLAILKAGGAYVPLDPDYPQERLDYMVQDAELNLILSFGKGDLVVTELAEKHDFFHVDLTNLALTGFADSAPVISELNADNLAYVIYTSGSTGRPKGVMLNHKGAVNLANNQQAKFGINEQSKVLHFASISFDAATWEWLMALIPGATLVIADHETRMDADQLIELLAKEAVTHATLPPALLSTLEYRDDLALECLIVAGEACESEVVNRWSQNYRFFNAYGPSETSVCATVGELNSGDHIHIGTALNNVELLVLDQDLNLVPFGSAGELFVGGDGLARGYLNQPQMTAERFIDNPYANNSASPQRLYRTGDLVQYLADGNLSFIGRVDDQVKVRGFRVELGEIAHQLSLQVAIDSAIVLAKSGPGGKYLVAYLKPMEKCESDNKNEFIDLALRELATQVPDYMLPSQTIMVSDWPLTPNGKIDKKALPEPDASQLQGEYVSPHSEVEADLVSIWSKLLDLPSEQISTTANFFSLGGHSLLSVRLASEIRTQLSVEITVKTLFSVNTIQGQAKVVAASQGEVLRQTVVSVDRVQYNTEGSSILPVSFAQQRLWFIDQLQGQSAEYNMPAAFNVDGPLDLNLVERVLNTIIERHEILRTVYQDGELGVEQIIQQSIEFKLQHNDVSDLDALSQQQTIAECMQTILEVPFNLREDLMVKAAYIKTAKERGILLFNMHHIASDGWSMQILVKEFVQLYQAYSVGQSDPLPPLSIQYGDYAYWQRDFLQGEVLDKQLGYWQQQLSEVPQVHSLPLDFTRPEIKQHQGAIVSGQLNPEIGNKLTRLAKAHGLTPFMLLHGTLALLLSRHSNSQDIIVGTPLANRLQAELEPLIGFFVNTLILRVNTAKQNLSEYFTHVKEVHLAAQTNQDVPFEQLVEKLGVSRSTAHTPLFQIMLTTQTDYGLNHDISDSAWSLNGIELSPMEEESVLAKFDLDIKMIINEEGVALNWTYDTALFSHEHITRLNTHLCRLLAGLAELDTQTLNNTLLQALPMLSEEEEDHLLVDLNQTQIEYNNQLSIHRWFEQQVMQNPTAIALISGDTHISYDTLNHRANKLAHYLMVEYKIINGSKVGICLERSENILIAMLAVLKAGAAYVPFDHQNTQHRNEQIINDAGIKLVFSDEARQPELPVNAEVVIMTELEKQGDLLQYSYDNPAINCEPTDLAYVIYTSGTTGKPKGVQISHHNVCDYLQSANHSYAKECKLDSLLVTSYAFDISVPSLFLPLMNGRFVEVLAHDNLFVSMQKKLHQHAYLLRMTPNHVQAILTLMNNQVCEQAHTFVIGGEAFALELADSLQASFPNSVIYNHYGPTETTVGSILLNVTKSRDLCENTMLIGSPLPNTQVYVLNEDLSLAPQGATGELYIAGPGLSQGYLNQNKLTKECFIVNPYNDQQLIYKTGDLARYTDTGLLTYCGRIDEQVKIRGYRIETGEIESQLQSELEIDSALVVTKQIANQKQLVAYIKLDLTREIKNSLTNDDGDLYSKLLTKFKRHLTTKLPEYMVPSSFVVIEQWPMSANGKLNKKALPEPELSTLQECYIAPESDFESKLVDIWSEILSLPEKQISTAANFFALGGNSLSVMSLMHQIRTEFSVEIDLAELYQGMDIRQIAQKVTHLQWLQDDDDLDCEELVL